MVFMKSAVNLTRKEDKMKEKYQQYLACFRSSLCFSLALIIFVFIGVNCLIFSSTAEAKEVEKLVYAHTGNNVCTTYWAAEEFKNRVEKYSNGKIEVEVHPAGSMGSDVKIIEMVRLGTLDIAITSNANYATQGRALLPFDLPYLVHGRYNWYRVLTGPIRDEMFDRVSKDNYTLLMWYPIGAERDLYFVKRPVHVPADAKGMKFRAAANPTEFKILKAWGFNPVPIPWSETYTSLKQGIAEGWNSAPMWAYIGKLHEVTKYATRMGGVGLLHIVVMNQKRFQSFSKELQEAILRAGIEAELAGHIQDEYWNDYGERKMIEAGNVFYTPKGEELQQWVEPAKALWEPIIKKMKLDKEFIKRVQDAQIPIDQY